MYSLINFLSTNFSGLATITAALIAGFIANKYQRGSLKISHKKMEKELFKEFNERYDKLSELNVDLNTMALREDYYIDLQKNIIEYFNLRAEQNYWYKKERISKDIWNIWHSGMIYYYKRFPVVQELWEKETEGGKLI